MSRFMSAKKSFVVFLTKKPGQTPQLVFVY